MGGGENSGQDITNDPYRYEHKRAAAALEEHKLTQAAGARALNASLDAPLARCLCTRV